MSRPPLSEVARIGDVLAPLICHSPAGHRLALSMQCVELNKNNQAAYAKAKQWLAEDLAAFEAQEARP